MLAHILGLLHSVIFQNKNKSSVFMRINQQIPSVSGKVPLEIKQPLEAIRGILNSITQGKHPNIVTTNTLRQLGLATTTAGGGLAPNDTQLMPAIKNLAVTGAFSSILLSWDGINSTAFSHTEIHRATADDIGQAVLVGTTSASVFSDTPPNNATTVTYYYWVRAVNKANVAGPFNSTSGTSGSTASDPAYALELLAGNISESSLASSLASRINLIDTPTTGLVDSMTAIEQLQAAQNLAVTTAQEALQSAQGLLSLDATASAESILQNVLSTSEVLNSTFSVAGNLANAEQQLSVVQSDLLIEANYRIALEAKLNSSIALFSSDAAAQVDALGAITTQFTTLQAAIDNNLALINTNNSASVTRDNAEVAARQDLAAKILGADGTGTISGLIAENKTISLNADQALANDISTLYVNYNNNLAAIQSEATARADAISAMSNRVDTIEANVSDNTAAIQTEATTRADADSAEASARQSLAAQFQGNVDTLTAAINSIQSASSNGILANTNQINEAVSALEKSAEAVLQGVLAGNTNTQNRYQSLALIKNEETTRATALEAVSNTINTLQSLLDGNTAAIQTEATTRADADSALSSLITTLQALSGENTAAIQTEATTRADADSALSSLITTLQALSGENTAAIQTEASVRAMALAPDWVANTAYAVDAIVVYNGAAKICTTANADAVFTAANWADYNITQAQYSIKTDVNGKVAGFALANNGVTSDFIVNVDRFGIATGNPTDPDSYPFIVANDPTTGVPTVYIKAASIQDASITNAHIKNIAADKILAGTITAAIELIAPLIRSNGATALNVGSGIYIDANAKTMRIGDPQGNHLLWDGADLTIHGGGTFSGDISAASGNFGGQAGSIAGQGGLATLSVVGNSELGNASVDTLKIGDNAATINVSANGNAIATLSLTIAYTASILVIGTTQMSVYGNTWIQISADNVSWSTLSTANTISGVTTTLASSTKQGAGTYYFRMYGVQGSSISVFVSIR